MRTALVVIDPPRLDQPLCLIDRSEPMDVQAFVAQRSVESFDEGVVGWFVRSGKVYSCFMMIRPEVTSWPVNSAPLSRRGIEALP